MEKKTSIKDKDGNNITITSLTNGEFKIETSEKGVSIDNVELFNIIEELKHIQQNGNI